MLKEGFTSSNKVAVVTAALFIALNPIPLEIDLNFTNLPKTTPIRQRV